MGSGGVGGQVGGDSVVMLSLLIYVNIMGSIRVYGHTLLHHRAT